MDQYGPVWTSINQYKPVQTGPAHLGGPLHDVGQQMGVGVLLLRAHTSTDQYKPVQTSINQYKPARTGRDQYGPVWTTMAQYKPVRTTMDR